MATLSTDSAWLQNNVNVLNAQLALSTASELQSANNKQNLYNAIIANKNTDIASANSDLLSQSNAIHGLYYYQGRNNQLNNVNNALLGTTTGQANALQNDNDLAKRQNEINEWETGNKMDTLFIYQQLLIILCATIILSFLWQKGMIGTTVFTIFMVLLALIFIFTTVNRAQYTNFKRDLRYWNQRRFPTSQVAPNACAVAEQIGDNINAISDLGGYSNKLITNITTGL
jgi:hypothetical protein